MGEPIKGQTWDKGPVADKGEDGEDGSDGTLVGEDGKNAYSNTLNVLHEHDYSDSYKWKDYKMHYAFCDCGKSRTMGHIVSGVYSGKRQICLLCGGRSRNGLCYKSKK